MKERPILFSGEMVRAIIDGRKTQTRRVVKPPKKFPEYSHCDPFAIPPAVWWWNGEHKHVGVRQECPFGVPGDRLWVREAWNTSAIQGPGFKKYRYRADNNPLDIGDKWRPSIHMPRWASRILLEITGVRVERLQDISEEDARAEGIIDGGCLSCGMDEPCGCRYPHPDPVDAFIHLWESINGPDSWAANPWVWCIEFENVDQ